MRPLGIELITVFGLPPVAYVNLAADLGVRDIGIALTPMPPNPHNYPAWSLRDAALRRETVAALKDRGVTIALGEGFMVRPGADIRDAAADIEMMRDLGARRIGTLSIDPDRNRSFDQFAALAEMADEAGLETVLEFAPIMMIPDLPTSLAVIAYVGRPSFKLMLDTMHIVRSGATAADIAALPPSLIGHVQLCDGVGAFTTESYINEARFERKAPGAGAFPLADIIRALPNNQLLGLELPSLSAAEAGISMRDHLVRCLATTRALLATIEA